MTIDAAVDLLHASNYGGDPAYTDHLTKIWNRRYFDQQLNHCVEDGALRADEADLLLLDLDRFKAVNDSLGHAVGDSLLCMVAQRVTSLLRPSDIFARLGGDEFAILTVSTSETDRLAKTIVELLQRTFLIEGCPVTIGVSIGIANAPRDGGERGELMRGADLALYQAKAMGRSCFVRFEPTMAVRASEKRALEIALRKALALRQLVLQYRPHMDVATQKLVALEAVLLWKHPTLGLLNAAAFIPLAEEIGQVVPIGEWAVRGVCREAARWPANVTCALSVSPLLFEADRFYEATKRALEAADIEGHRLELEVTEGILLRDGKAVLTMLERLRLLGVRVAVDSFGTGMASLSQMVDFPLDKIKIARSLVEENVSGIKERAIVRAIAALGSSLGISTIVEGVSTQEHLARIQQDGCASLQGSYIGNAVSAASLNSILDELRAFSHHGTLQEVQL